MKNHRKPLSRFFPAHHPKAGQQTWFVEKVWKSLCDAGMSIDYSIEVAYTQAFGMKFMPEENIHAHAPKHHTIRACNISKRTGNHLKVEVGDTVQFYVWSGKPYASKQIVVTPRIEVKRVWDFKLEVFDMTLYGFINGKLIEKELAPTLALNDGLSSQVPAIPITG